MSITSARNPLPLRKLPLSSPSSDLIPLSLSSSPLGLLMSCPTALNWQLSDLSPAMSPFLPRMPHRCHKTSRNLSSFLRPPPLPTLPSPGNGHTISPGPGQQGGSDSSRARHLSPAPHPCLLTFSAFHPPWFSRDSPLPAGTAARPPCLNPLCLPLCLLPAHPAHSSLSDLSGVSPQSVRDKAQNLPLEIAHSPHRPESATHDLTLALQTPRLLALFPAPGAVPVGLSEPAELASSAGGISHSLLCDSMPCCSDLQGRKGNGPLRAFCIRHVWGCPLCPHHLLECPHSPTTPAADSRSLTPAHSSSLSLLEEGQIPDSRGALPLATQQ